MVAYVIKRVGLALLVIFVVSLVGFLALRLTGDPAVAMAGEASSEADIRNIRLQYGFDRPILIQYADWLGRAVRGDFGVSNYFRLPVSDLIMSRFPTTALLAAFSISFALIISIPLGIIAAVRQNSWIDRLALLFAVSGQAMPNFWLALLLIVLFSVTYPLLPPSGSGEWVNFIMPTIVLGTHAMPALMRLTRNGMLDVLASDYMRTARAKGLRWYTVLFKHGLRNAMIPLVALTAVQFGFLLSGSIVTEAIFALHGLGHLAWESITRRDIPTVQAVLIILATFYTLLTLLGDLLNAWLDPRIRVS
ncbi:MAG: ABC transporter permease [Salinarimonadaceae bacterium]|nr:MAG: ABC transporter permease [Salinarimonadaceae bacterium]